MSEIKDLLDFFDSRLSGEEVLHEARCSAVRKECKQKGFPQLEAQGLIIQKRRKKKNPNRQKHGYSEEKRASIALEIKQINKYRMEGMSTPEACDKVGVQTRYYYTWSEKLGISKETS